MTHLGKRKEKATFIATQNVKKWVTIMKTCICLQNPISFVCLLNHHNPPIPLTDLQHQDSHFPNLSTQLSEILQVKKKSDCEIP